MTSPTKDEALPWRCFHCDEVFTDQRCAENHFGRNESSEPACLIKAGAEQSLLEALRRAEGASAEAWGLLHSESSDFAKAYHSQAARHSQQLRTAEELGYERGLRDGRALPPSAGVDENAVIEKCAAVAEMMQFSPGDVGFDPNVAAVHNQTCQNCASTIRALKVTP